MSIRSTPIKLGEGTVDNLGDVSITVTILADIPVGQHSLALEGIDSDGMPIKYIQPVFVTGSPEDIDDDGVRNGDDACAFLTASNIDANKDGIDDACDANATKPCMGQGGTDNDNTGTPSPSSTATAKPVMAALALASSQNSNSNSFGFAIGLNSNEAVGNQTVLPHLNANCLLENNKQKSVKAKTLLDLIFPGVMGGIVVAVMAAGGMLLLAKKVKNKPRRAYL